jgi:hypothetical protein
MPNTTPSLKMTAAPDNSSGAAILLAFLLCFAGSGEKETGATARFFIVF